MMPLYVSKPSTIEAVQWTGENTDECVGFAPGKVMWDREFRGGAIQIELLAGKDGAQGWVPVPLGHWLVNQPGDKSDIWPVDPDYFGAKYQLADGGAEGDGSDEA